MQKCAKFAGADTLKWGMDTFIFENLFFVFLKIWFETFQTY